MVTELQVEPNRIEKAVFMFRGESVTVVGYRQEGNGSRRPTFVGHSEIAELV